MNLTAHLDTFIHLALIGFVALFPVVNPVGTAFIISPYFSDLSRKERLKAVKKITFNALLLCAFTLFLGHWILQLFGLSIPIIQLAGGVMICKIGWESLAADNTNAKQAEAEETAPEDHSIENKLFYPITFPMTTGAGTIAVLFTLSAHGANKDMTLYLLNVAALLVSVIGICILIFIFYLNTNRVIRYIGSQNEVIINRMMAFLIFCVGLQIAFGGVASLIHTISAS